MNSIQYICDLIIKNDNQIYFSDEKHFERFLESPSTTDYFNDDGSKKNSGSLFCEFDDDNFNNNILFYLVYEKFDLIHEVINSTSFNKKNINEFMKFNISEGTYDLNIFSFSCMFSRKLSSDKIVKLLLNHPKIDINLENKNGDTPLFLSIKYLNNSSSEETLKILLNHPKIDINLQNKNGDTALMIAAKFSDNNAYNFLLECPNIDINLQNKNGDTALMIAAFHSNSELCKILLNRSDININIQNKMECTILHFASYYLLEDVVELLLKLPNIEINNKDNNGYTPLLSAISSKIINKLKQKNAFMSDIFTNNNTLNILKQKRAQMLLNYSEIDAKINTLNKSKQKIVEMFLNCPDTDINTLNIDGKNALMILLTEDDTLHKNKEIIEFLLENSDINLQDKEGNTALMLVINNPIKRIVKRLLKCTNINVNIKNNDGDTAIMLLINNILDKKNDILINDKIFELLLNHSNIDVNLQNAHGNTILMEIISKTKIDVVEGMIKKLLEKCSNINIQNNSNETLLILAIKNINIGIMGRITTKILEHSKINLNIQNNKNEPILMKIIEIIDNETILFNTDLLFESDKLCFINNLISIMTNLDLKKIRMMVKILLDNIIIDLKEINNQIMALDDNTIEMLGNFIVEHFDFNFDFKNVDNQHTKLDDFLIKKTGKTYSDALKHNYKIIKDHIWNFFNNTTKYNLIEILEDIKIHISTLDIKFILAIKFLIENCKKVYIKKLHNLFHRLDIHNINHNMFVLHQKKNNSSFALKEYMKYQKFNLINYRKYHRINVLNKGY
jgi:ankyrin repeat protein